MKLGELETRSDERPLFDAKIITADVLANPFDDIEPRITREEKQMLEEEKERLKNSEIIASKPKGKK